MGKYKKISIYILNFIIIVFGLISSIYIFKYDIYIDGYEKLYLLPLVYTILYIVFMSRAIIYSKSVFLWTFFIISFLRYIILPNSIILKQSFGGIAYLSPDPSSINKGIYLMIYELIISSILIYYNYKKNIPIYLKMNHYNINNNFKIKNKFIYTIIILLSLVILISYPKILRGISFFTNLNRISLEESSIIISLGIQMVMLSKLLVYFIGIEKLNNMYKKTNKTRYIIYVYILSFLNIGIFVGTNRKRMVMNAVSSSILINYLFPEKKRKTIIIIFLLCSILFLQVTILRFYSGKDRHIFDNTANTLQVYLSGPYNMALAIETKELYGNEIVMSNVIYDILRPFYGLGHFLKNTNMNTSKEYFNNRISIGGRQRGDQIIPMTGQGLLHFGYLFSPIYMVITIWLGFRIENALRKTKSIEIKYLLSLLCMILGQAMSINFIIIINFITFESILFYIIYYLNNKISTRKPNSINDND